MVIRHDSAIDEQVEQVRALLDKPPCRIAAKVAARLTRAQRREEAKSRNAAELLAHERKNGVSARSWRAAILARVVAGQVDTDE